MDKAATFFLILTIILLLEESVAEIDNTRRLESRFGTKTVYEHRLPEKNCKPWTPSAIPDNLKPIMVDVTLRHGTRFPSEKRIVKWRTVVPKFELLIKSSSNFSEAVKFEISNWVEKFANCSYYLLCSLGWKEHVSLGFKLYSILPELFSQILSSSGVSDDDDLLILSSNKVRAKASAQAFLAALDNANEGLTSSDHPNVRYVEQKVGNESNRVDTRNIVQYGRHSVLVNDELLRFFDHCEKYVHSVDTNETAHIEFEKFFRSKEMQSVTQRFGEFENPKDIYYIYQLCAFEKAVYNDSIWCNLFSDTDLDILEYASDLKHYYTTGYGYDINVEQSCHLLQHIFDRYEKKPNNRFRATFRFGHAETLIPLVNLLGFYAEDSPLRADNYAQKGDRIFRTGRISPFSGNLAIVVYESKFDHNKKFISFVLNEQIIKPFGLDCYFCEFGNESVAYQELKKKLIGCNSVCKLDRFQQRGMKEEL